MRVLSAGMGRQCSAILALVERGDIPPYDLIIFADTMNEPPAVYRNVDYWIKRGHQIKVVTAGNLSERLDTIPLYVKGKLKARQCTKDYKIIPIRGAILDEMVRRGLAAVNAIGRRRVKPGVSVEQHIGFSADEQYRIARRSYNPSWLTNIYPLAVAGIRSSDCVRILQTGGHPVVRSACIFCPYTSDERLKSMAPDERELLIRWDEHVRSSDFVKLYPKLDGSYIHKSGRPMRDVLQWLDQLPVQRAFDGFADEALDACRSDGANCMT